MNVDATYPWLQAQWRGCMERLRAGRLPHALLVSGERGVGVGDFTEQLTGACLCLEDDRPCGRCRACKLHSGGNHPDFMRIEAEKEGGEIKSGQIRELLSFLQISRHYDGLKTVLIVGADAMNRSAANGLLKMLEEPPGDTVMVLTSHSPFSLPATVRSRCQAVRLSCPDRRALVAWLAAAGNVEPAEAERRLDDHAWRPVHALAAGDENGERGKDDFLEDVDAFLQKRSTLVEVSEKWAEQPALKLHQWLLERAEETIRREFTAQRQGLPLRKLFSFYDRQKHRCLTLKVHLNPRLLLESALIEWGVVHAAAA